MIRQKKKAPDGALNSAVQLQILVSKVRIISNYASCRAARNAAASDALEAAVKIALTRPPVNDLGKRSLRARILALLAPWIASCSSGSISASQVGQRSLRRRLDGLLAVAVLRLGAGRA